MDINEYQAKAAETLQFDRSSNEAVSISLLGLSGEVGELSTEYKKKIRDGDSYKIFREKIVEEMGDIMWYLSSIATHEGIEFSEILHNNVKKINERWNDLNAHGQLSFDGEFLDDGCGEEEKFPREFVAEFKEVDADDGKSYVTVSVNGSPFGNDLRDNAYDNDCYRFHDVFHFSYVVTLGWSPIARRFLKCKRVSNDLKDEVEDGGRASVIDEAISVLVFEHARNHNFFEGAGGVDYQLLRTIKSLTKHLEVKSCTPKEWENAILLGFEVWRKLKKNKSGRIVCDMHEKTMHFEKLD